MSRTNATLGDRRGRNLPATPQRAIETDAIECDTGPAQDQLLFEQQLRSLRVDQSREFDQPFAVA